jgi:small GTP-binding protein
LYLPYRELHGTGLKAGASFDGIPVRLFDTAGLRETTDAVEKQGVELTRSLTNDADIVLYLIDSSIGFEGDDAEFLRQCDEPVVIVWNKCDTGGPLNGLTAEQKEVIKRFGAEVYVSAKKRGRYFRFAEISSKYSYCRYEYGAHSGRTRFRQAEGRCRRSS